MKTIECNDNGIREVKGKENTENEVVLYSFKDAQRILGIGKNNMYKLMKLPTFPVFRIGKRYFIPKKEFEEWIHNSIHKKLL